MAHTIRATQHTCEPAERAFGRRVDGCPRCTELAAGAAPRAGWQRDHFGRKAREEAALIHAIRNHDCKACNCGIVCTAFQW